MTWRVDDDHIDTADVAGKLALAVRSALDGDLDKAREAVLMIRPEACRAEKREAESLIAQAKARAGDTVRSDRQPSVDDRADDQGSRKKNTWESGERYHRRDGYRCRYAHCNRRTVDLRVVKALADLLPDVLPFHPNWKRDATHPLVWTDTASLEHIVPISRGGTDGDDNFASTCACCNYAKNDTPLDVLGWEVLPVPAMNPDGWMGLVDELPALEALVASIDRPDDGEPRRSSPHIGEPIRVSASETTKRSNASAPRIEPDDIRVDMLLSFARPEHRRRRRYRVITREVGHIEVVEMWVDRVTARWTEGRTTYRLALDELTDIRVVVPAAPRGGDPA